MFAAVFVMAVMMVVTPSAQAQNIDVQARDLTLMQTLFHGGSGVPVTFDSGAAREQGFSENSIQLAEQMAAATNDLVSSAERRLRNLVPPLKSSGRREAEEQTLQSIDVRALEVDLTPYATLGTFLDDARRFRRELDSLPPEQQDITLDARAMVFGTQSVLDSINPFKQCGYYDNPLPTSAKPRVYYSSSNPSSTLTSWGYHADPLAIRIGAGWTRAQTYKWWICGWGTFRDNANPVGSNRFWEQNYDGWTPRGEPNPEVWRSGPWPYPTWPLYVNWWHSKF
jgi:hypothetical protein